MMTLLPFLKSCSFLSWQNFFFFCLSNPEEQVGEQGGLGRIKTAAGPPAGDRKEKCPQLPKQRYSALSLLSHPLANSHPQDNGSQHHLGTSPGLGLPPPQQCGSYLLTSTAPKPSPTGEKTAAPFLSLCPPLPQDDGFPYAGLLHTTSG